MHTFNLSQSIGDIVSIMPKASEVFKEYDIDFCCGGNRPLSEAIREQKLDGWEVLQKLQALESDLFEHIHLENNILFKGISLKVQNMI